MPEDFKEASATKPRRKKSRGSSTQLVKQPRARRNEPDMLSLPKSWFTLEYFKALRKKVRGPVSKTRRTMATVKARVPKEVWAALVSNMKEDDVSSVQWEDGVMQPTKQTPATMTYEFDIKRPMVADRIFSLERADLKGVHLREGKNAWRRGLGCATLKLADAAKPGRQASSFAMVGGNVVVKALVPRGWRSWPTITLKFWILTVDYQGNILWPTQWDQDACNLLKELARRKVSAFKADSSYPIRADFWDTPGVTSAVLSKDNSPPLPAPLVTTTPLALPAPH